MVIDRYYKWYNEKGRHGSLNGQTPDTVWKQYLIRSLLNTKNDSTIFEKQPSL